MLQIKNRPYGARLLPIAAVTVILIVVDQAMSKLKLTYELTSGLEGEYGPSSLHYAGFAYDFIVHGNMSLLEHELPERVAARLGQDFDVIWNGTKRQLHVKFQPKISFKKLEE